MDNAVALAALTLAGTIATGFFAVINKQNKIHGKIAVGLEKMAKSSDRVAKATEKSANEARERNGHLAELIVQSSENTKVLAETATNQIISAVQNVDVQKVEHQVIKESS